MVSDVQGAEEQPLPLQAPVPLLLVRLRDERLPEEEEELQERVELLLLEYFYYHRIHRFGQTAESILNQLMRVRWLEPMQIYCVPPLLPAVSWQELDVHSM